MPTMPGQFLLLRRGLRLWLVEAVRIGLAIAVDLLGVASPDTCKSASLFPKAPAIGAAFGTV